MRSLIGILLSLTLVSCGSGNYGTSRSELANLEALAVNDPGLTGAYKVKTYVPSGSNSGYQSVIVYYPDDGLQTALAATTLVGGFTNTKEQMSWLGLHLASHGLIVAVFTPTNPYSLDAKVWANGHKASINTLIAENGKTTSPVAGRIATDRLGLMGYSYGGAGAILASNELKSKVRSMVTFCAYNPATPTNPIPSMFITGTKDTVASPAKVLTAFNNLKTDAPKAFAKFNGLNHTDVPNNGPYHETMARFATAWSQVFLADNVGYETYINGAEAEKQIKNTTVFAKTSDWIYQE